MKRVKLGINIDHVATVREARRIFEPDPVASARECIKAGCDSIVCHLREDRRHIKDADVIKLRKAVPVLNLEMSIARDIVDFACRIKPDQVTIVPEKRQEITTEGGLDVKKGEARLRQVVRRLHENGIDVSLFINPSIEQIDATIRVGARIVEFHTGKYAGADCSRDRKTQLDILKRASSYASAKSLTVNAGHGLNYDNVKPIAKILCINELNIGHSIISRAIFTGIKRAVKDMISEIK